jgi:hypothetical protein
MDKKNLKNCSHVKKKFMRLEEKFRGSKIAVLEKISMEFKKYIHGI